MSAEAYELVKELFKFRDHYFVNNPVCDKPSKRDEDVDKKLQASFVVFILFPNSFSFRKRYKKLMS